MLNVAVVYRVDIDVLICVEKNIPNIVKKKLKKFGNVDIANRYIAIRRVI